jgi:hypothetical protein
MRFARIPDGIQMECDKTLVEGFEIFRRNIS